MRSDFSAILRAHHARYPLMRPCDVVKLIYQSVFGSGHFVGDYPAALDRVKQEYASVSHEGEHRGEPIGDCTRVSLKCELSDGELELLTGMFAASSAYFPAGYPEAEEQVKAYFITRLDTALSLASAGVFGFTMAELADYLTGYEAAGYPAVSHSAEYRAAYQPAYRVIDARYDRLYAAMRAIYQRLAAGERITVALDGRAASGKTTAARLMADCFRRMGFSSEVVHLDDFFLPFALRTPERLAEAGGNLHRERFLDEVVGHLRDDEGFAYRVFDCSVGDYHPSARTIAPARLLICEGAYALHPAFGHYDDLAIFSSLSPDEQEKRILERNGSAMLERFKSAWIPMEERYFEVFGIEDRIDFFV